MKTQLTTIKGNAEYVNEQFSKISKEKGGLKGEYPTKFRKRGIGFTNRDNICYRVFFQIDGRFNNFTSVQEY